MKAISTKEAPAAIGPYSQAIDSGAGLVFVSGQLPIDPATGAFPEGGVAEQARQSLLNAQAILRAAGLELADVVKTTVFLADMGDFAAMNAVYATFFAEPFPARSAVAVKTLPKGALVEIWIGGFLGWVAWGPIGALIGYLLGKAVDTYIDGSHQLPGGDGWERQQGQGTYRQQTGQSPYGQTQSRQNRYTADEQRNSFFVSLLVLSSAVIKADGRTHPAELRTVREFIRTNFGEQAASQAEQILQRLDSQQVNIYSVGGQIAANMNYSQRLQLFQYLVSIATADGDFSASEKSVLEAIASAIRLTSSDAASIIAMYYKETDSAYTVLEISPSATDDEVRTAYRRMAMKYHPDRVATLGPDVQKAAEEKFKKIQEAYAAIKKQRGIQ